jgi:hypothetical protein
MITDRYTAYQETLREEGSVQLDLGANPFDEETWQEIDALTSPERVPYERIAIGDAGEENFTDVARFMVDMNEPTHVPSASNVRLMELLSSPRMMGIYQELTGLDGLCIRRCQVNVLHDGGFVGLHLDTDSNPDYQHPVILQMGSEYSGGDYVVHPPNTEPKVYRLPRYSMLISSCWLPHEVTKVTSGERKSLVFFLSQYAGPNRRSAESQRSVQWSSAFAASTAAM